MCSSISYNGALPTNPSFGVTMTKILKDIFFAAQGSHMEKPDKGGKGIIYYIMNSCLTRESNVNLWRMAVPSDIESASYAGLGLSVLIG